MPSVIQIASVLLDFLDLSVVYEEPIAIPKGMAVSLLHVALEKCISTQHPEVSELC